MTITHYHLWNSPEQHVVGFQRALRHPCLSQRKLAQAQMFPVCKRMGSTQSKKQVVHPVFSKFWTFPTIHQRHFKEPQKGIATFSENTAAQIVKYSWCACVLDTNLTAKSDLQSTRCFHLLQEILEFSRVAFKGNLPLLVNSFRAATQNGNTTQRSQKVRRSALNN